jgi:mRNA interferase MazF
MTLKTGDIYWVNLEPSIGDEIRKKQPVVVMNPGHSRYLKLAIVVPITHWRPEWKDHAFFVLLDPSPSNGLERRSAVDCFQIRAISHGKFLERLGAASDAEIEQMKRAIAFILDIDPEHCQ